MRTSFLAQVARVSLSSFLPLRRNLYFSRNTARVLLCGCLLYNNENVSPSRQASGPPCRGDYLKIVSSNIVPTSNGKG